MSEMPLYGIADLPGFEASLRLLVEREKYSLTDIALMFGVSKERISQLCVRLRIDPVQAWKTGMNCVRVWDDTTHQFQPVMKGAISAERVAVARSEKRARQTALRETNRAHIMAAIQQQRDAVGRDLTWEEMYVAVVGRPSEGHWPCVKLLKRWDSRQRALKEILEEFKQVTGFGIRSRGWQHDLPHHVVHPRRSVCARGHPFDDANTMHNADGRRRCRTCHRKGTSASYYRRKQQCQSA